MAATPEGMNIQNGVLVGVTNEYINNQNGHLTIPDHVTGIRWGAFSHNLGLRSATIPSSVTKIGQFVFCNCANLQSVVMSDSVTEIGDDAFIYCTSLTKITIIVSDPSYEKAEKLKNMLPKRLHDKVQFELPAAYNIKVDSLFFSPSSDSNNTQPESSNNSPAP